MPNTIIEIENATKDYVSGQTTFQALKGINLKINKGEFVSIVGPSGSGKSTLLHLLGCLDNPTTGKIKLDGMEVSKMNEDELASARNKKIGFVFQAFNLAPTLNVYKNVELPLMIAEIDSDKREDMIRKQLKVVELFGKENNKTSQLSGGEKQRVAIARALVNNPEIILADEPTGNLDSKTGGDIMDFLSSLWKEKQLTIILVTHEPVVASYSQRVIHIRDGKVEKEILQRPRNPGARSNIKIKEVSA